MSNERAEPSHRVILITLLRKLNSCNISGRSVTIFYCSFIESLLIFSFYLPLMVYPLKIKTAHREPWRSAAHWCQTKRLEFPPSVSGGKEDKAYYQSTPPCSIACVRIEALKPSFLMHHQGEFTDSPTLLFFLQLGCWILRAVIWNESHLTSFITAFTQEPCNSFMCYICKLLLEFICCPFLTHDCLCWLHWQHVFVCCMSSLCVMR